jgi:hypothetical protein
MDNCSQATIPKALLLNLLCMVRAAWKLPVGGGLSRVRYNGNGKEWKWQMVYPRREVGRKGEQPISLWSCNCCSI